ncbi:hypothetical protein AAG906_035420 [Vitis piasezkii]
MDKQGPLPSLYLSIQNPTPMVKDLTTISERMYTQMVMKVTCPPLPASQPSDILVSNKNPCDNSLWHPDKNAENVGEFSETNIQQTTEDSSGRKHSRGGCTGAFFIQLQTESGAAFLHYQQSLEKLSNLERNLNHEPKNAAELSS